MTEKNKIETPATLVVFGATGDLFRKKIIPATYLLKTAGRLPNHFHVIGFGRRPLTDAEFRTRIVEALDKSGLEPDAAKASAFAQCFSYIIGEFDDATAFARLRAALAQLGMHDRAFYLAVPPSNFHNLFEKLAGAGLTTEHDRVMIEKPFGGNLEEAVRLNESVRGFFDESSIYAIEHYLAKDTLRALPALRRSHGKLKSLLTPDKISAVHVRLLETIGVEDRGHFYDPIGAWRDVGSNHLLHMLGLSLMDLPEDESTSAFQAARAAFLDTLPRLSDADIATGVTRGQHEDYHAIAGVVPGSITETYFKVGFTLSGKFADVPVTLESGKRFKEAKKGIEIALKPDAGATHIHIDIEPEMRITIRSDIDEVVFANDEGRHIQYAGQYADLIVDAFRGDHTWFVSDNEIEAAWRFADPITNAFKNGAVPLKIYTPGIEAVL